MNMICLEACLYIASPRVKLFNAGQRSCGRNIVQHDHIYHKYVPVEALHKSKTPA